MTDDYDIGKLDAIDEMSEKIHPILLQLFEVMDEGERSKFIAHINGNYCAKCGRHKMECFCYGWVS